MEHRPLLGANRRLNGQCPKKHGNFPAVVSYEHACAGQPGHDLLIEDAWNVYIIGSVVLRCLVQLPWRLQACARLASPWMSKISLGGRASLRLKAPSVPLTSPAC